MNLFIFNFNKKNGLFLFYMLFWLFLFETIAYFCVFVWNDNKTLHKISKPIQNGFSVEYRQKKQMEREIEKPGSLLKYYWAQPESWIHEPQIGAPLVSFYGMSFSMYLAENFKKRTQGIPELKTRVIFSPAAPLSHSYASFLVDTQTIQPQFAMLSILGNSLYALHSMTHSGRNVEADYEYNYPLFQLDEKGELIQINPVISSFEDYMASYHSPEIWNKQLEQFKKYEPYYSDFVFQKSVWDYSALARIFRVWTVKNKRRAAEGWDYDSQAQLKKDSKAVPLMNKILLEFIQKAKDKNIIPMIFLVSNVPENALYLALNPEVKKNAFILNSEDYCPYQDRSNFKKDGHFTDECDQKMIQPLLEFIFIKTKNEM